MIISVCGKGGSGKSTIVALLADGFRRHGKGVVVLDSDESNSSLFWMLGLDRPPRPLMDLVGGKKNVQEKMIAKFTGDGKVPVMIWEMEKIPSKEIPSDFVSEHDHYRLVVTGKIHQSMEGCACPMGVVTREFLKKLEPETDEVALVDMEAGLEHFGRGIESSIDRVVCVVEPSLESITLAAKVRELTHGAGTRFEGAVLNKISSTGQGKAVADKLDGQGISVLGVIGMSADIQSACLEGKPLDAGMAGGAIENIVSPLLQQDDSK